jgi:hypothetical protein
MREEAALRRLALFRVLAGAYALFATIAPLTRLPSLCPFRRVTGFRCPFCGLTRATRALTRGDFGNAVALHPLAPLLWVATALALTRRQEAS